MTRVRSPVLGYNHNIRHLGWLFHVQTEDSGVQNPHIFTHLFHGGVIITSKKTDYDGGADTEVVRRLMQSQHKAVLRELVAGTLDEKIQQYLGAKPKDFTDDASAAAPAEGVVAVPVVGGDTARTGPPTWNEPGRASSQADVELPADTEPQMAPLRLESDIPVPVPPPPAATAPVARPAPASAHGRVAVPIATPAVLPPGTPAPPAVPAAGRARAPVNVSPTGTIRPGESIPGRGNLGAALVRARQAGAPATVPPAGPPPSAAAKQGGAPPRSTAAEFAAQDVAAVPRTNIPRAGRETNPRGSAGPGPVPPPLAPPEPLAVPPAVAKGAPPPQSPKVVPDASRGAVVVSPPSVIVGQPSVVVGAPPAAARAAAAQAGRRPAKEAGQSRPGFGQPQRHDEPFGAGLISEKSLDEVILAYLSEDPKEE